MPEDIVMIDAESAVRFLRVMKTMEEPDWKLLFGQD